MTVPRALPVLTVVAILTTVPGFAGSKEQYLLEEGTELYTAQKYEVAIDLFDQLLEIEPTNWSANYLTAVSYVALYRAESDDPSGKEFAEHALVAFERTLQLTPPSPEDRQQAERSYVDFLDATGDRDKALAYLEKQLLSRPADVSLVRQLGAMYQRRGEFSRALEYFERHAQLDPDNKEVWYLLGVNCWARSYHGGLAVSEQEREAVVDKGIQALDRALEIDPDYFDALSYISLIYREKAKAFSADSRTVEAREAVAKADEYLQRAIDIRKRQTAKAAR